MRLCQCHVSGWVSRMCHSCSGLMLNFNYFEWSRGNIFFSSCHSNDTMLCSCFWLILSSSWAQQSFLCFWWTSTKPTSLISEILRGHCSQAEQMVSQKWAYSKCVVYSPLATIAFNSQLISHLCRKSRNGEVPESAAILTFHLSEHRHKQFIPHL